MLSFFMLEDFEPPFFLNLSKCKRSLASRALAKDLSAREVENRSIHFLTVGHEVAVLRVLGTRKH
jgi:hypothetical protein